MKSIYMYILILLIASASAAYSKVLYVSSYNTAMFSTPGGNAQIMTLNKGSQLNVLSENDSWVQVSSGAKTGWVKKTSTSTSMPGSKFSILGSAQNNARIHARVRASSDVTAASARGLTEDNKTASGRMRSADSGKDEFDYQTLLKIESSHISENELINFLSNGGIRSR